jgi:large subunit ribosomal protein L17
MRHRKRGRILGRNSTHRLAMMRNLTRNLIEHETIITTVAKAKELRPFVEKLITKARSGTLADRRLVLARLGNDKETTKKLFDTVGPRFKERPGGYIRILKRMERRLGDAAETALIMLLKEGETKEPKEKAAPAPAVAPPAAE